MDFKIIMQIGMDMDMVFVMILFIQYVIVMQKFGWQIYAEIVIIVIQV